MRHLKNTTCIIACLLLVLPALLHAQEDSIQVATETVETNGLKRYPYFNVDDFQQTTLFKVYMNTANIEERQGISRFIGQFGIEQKLFPSLSVELRGMFPDQSGFGRTSSFGGDLRYYLHKGKNSKSAKNRVNNFSGKYIAFSFDRSFATNTLFDESFDATSYSLSFGQQQKLGKWGFYDIAALLGYTEVDGTRVFGLGISVDGGVAYGNSKPADQTNTSSWEQELLPAWEGGVVVLSRPALAINENVTTAFVAPYAEAHLGQYFTIRPTVGLSFQRTSFSGSFSSTLFFLADLSLQFRRYLGVAKRAENGQETPRFNGPYMGLNFNRLFNYLVIDFGDGSFNESNASFNPNLLIGWQQNAGRKLFFDAFLSVGRDELLDDGLTVGVSAQVGWIIGQ